ncbi:hypothetical protein [Corynebacterium imitans]|nr:hypothetical protein [Corynebacterium imitans]MDK8773108.1 hypothetical protein [Corynebacterium imitans]
MHLIRLLGRYSKQYWPAAPFSGSVSDLKPEVSYENPTWGICTK